MQPKHKKDMRLQKAFAEFISGKKILIADLNATTRSTLARTLIELGAKQSNIDLVPAFDMAKEELMAREYPIVFCEYDFGRHCGLDLLQAQRSAKVDPRNSLFILVTANTSQSAVARAAEEDVDTYIIKPFSALALQERILAAAKEKLFPSEYQQKINQGKELLFAADYNGALGCFAAAVKLDKEPTLACFYLGQANMMKQYFAAAQDDYYMGLSFNRIHYKCLIGLYELFMKRSMHSEAYEVVQKIANYFPANPKRLGTVVRLAIMTHHYTDIERYYQTFINLDQRNEELIRYVCAGLVICGKFYLAQKQQARAIELFKKASVTGVGQTRILREIVVSLAENELYKQAEEFLCHFPPQAMESSEYKTAEFLVSCKHLSPQQVIEKGRKLISSDEADEITIYKVVILKMLEVGLQAAAEDLFEKAKRAFPEQKQDLEQLWTTRKMSQSRNAA